MLNVIVWDIETVPDIKGFAAANGHDGKSEDEIRAAMGDKFPKPSTTRSSASARWSRIVKKAVTGLSMQSEPPTLESGPRRR
jgi:hypothetical protein